jgi:two-component system, chemotaxis family, protein-glutamate methylesterase/glutaminase
MTTQRRRVLVVEDSLTIRKRFCEIIDSDPQLELVGEAEDGKRAIELCTQLRPDVISLDMMLPVMSGLAATEYIMAHVPTPILVVSASTNRAELFKTYEALSAGAVDVLEKPRGDEFDRYWETKYLSTLKLISRIKVITHPRARLGALGRPAPLIAPEVLPTLSARSIQLVAIGASTGGPAAIVDVLRGLPPLSVPLLLVMHIDEPFGAAFADWLDGQTSHRVLYARDGELLRAVGGRVLMAPPEKHLILAGGRLHLTTTAPRHSCRPSVDVLFESLASECGASVLACLLTGMGRDGAAGLLALRRAGSYTIAQDEATCVVYGMPREAVQLGAAERVLPIGDIGRTLGELLAEGRRNR